MQAWSSPPVPSCRGPLPALWLYDTAAGAVRPTDPGPTATMYVCGITPYDATHLGHAATYLAFDLVNRYWRAAGHRVHYVQNVTDIDDPLLERAQRDGVDWRDLAVRETDLFRSDMAALRVIPPEQYVGAVEAMDEVTAAVARLLDSGAAYRVDDPRYPDVYFDVATTGRFGYESGYDEATMRALAAERGGDPDRPGKRSPLDPLLWRLARPGEPAWESPMGSGRPGWHIECAVIATGRLGGRIDLQGGGSDLIFPHHECSAAHAEALTGEHPFAGHYVHAGMITLAGEKMSKSLGNLAFVSRLVSGGTDPMAIRVALLDGHYRAERGWSDDLLARSAARLASWRAAAARSAGQSTALSAKQSAGKSTGQSAARLAERPAERPAQPADKTVTELQEALADDLDTPRALAALDAWAADETLGGDEVAVAADALLGLSLRG